MSPPRDPRVVGGSVFAAGDGRTLSRRAELTLLAATLLLAVLIHSPALRAGFTFDDGPMIVYNPNVHSLSRWMDWFGGPYWTHDEGYGLYRPLVLASYAVTWAAVGPTPWVFHLTNILLHALVCALVWWTGKRVGLSPPAALVAAGLFAVHPVHSEVAAAIVNRTDSMVTIPILLAVGLYCSRGAGVRAHGCAGEPLALESSRRRALGPLPFRVLLVWLCFILALGCKESALILPALLIAAEITVYPGRWRAPGERAALIGAAVALIVTAFAYVGLVVAVCGRFGFDPALGSYPNATFWERLGVVPWTLGQYLRLLLWPLSLSPDYGHSLPEANALRQGLSLALLAVLGAGGLAGALALRRQAPAAALGLLWVGLSVAPYLHLVRGGAIVAERFVYLASVGLCWVVAAIWQRVFEGGCGPSALTGPHVRTPFTVALLLIAALFAGRSARQAWLWGRPLRLWEEAVATGRAGWIGWQNLGVYRLVAGDNLGALEAFDVARDLGMNQPENPQMRALALLRSGQRNAAEQAGRAGLAEFPRHVGLTVNTALAMLQRAGGTREAEALVEDALTEHPEAAELWSLLAIIRDTLGKRAQAEEARARVAELRRRYPRLGAIGTEGLGAP